MNVAGRNFNMRLLSVCMLVLLSNFPKGHSDQISSKLDFGSETTTSEYDSTLSSSLVKALVHLQHSTGPGKTIISSKLDQNPFNLRSIAPLISENPKPEFTSLGVICVDGKCNTADDKKSPEDKVSTDILVQVVTNVDNKEKKENKTAGEDNDVPIVVGYAGTNIQPNGLEPIPSSRRIDGNQDVTITTGTDTFTNEVPKGHFQHRVPYFEPSLNNHYFGESPPPQYVWYRRRNGYNPHAFVTNVRPFKPFNSWQLKYPATATHAPNGWSQTTACTCTNPGLNWYPSFGPNQPTPAAPVNDKLDPLNKK